MQLELQFNEKFMEDCIKESPLIFLGEKFEFKYQQYELHGFFPDLIFEDASGLTTIVEVQQKALDRYHLYKSLEYRDLMQKRTGHIPRVIVFCNSVRDHHAPLLQTHNIECISVEQDRFIELAQKHCAKTYNEALLEKPAEIEFATDHFPEEPSSRYEYEFRRLPWYRFQGTSQYLKHFYCEMGRLGLINEENELCARSRDNVIYDLEGYIDAEDENYEARQALYNLSPLNFDLLKRRCESGYFYALGHDFAKPRIDLIPYITSKGNLSVCWRPTDWENPYQRECDWRYWYSTVDRTWKRPIDELMFIRGVGLLRPDPAIEYGPYLRYDKPAVDSILISAVRAAFEHLVSQLSISFEVRKINDFNFELGDSDDNDLNRSVINWNLYNVREREEEKEAEWLENFESSYGISIDNFLHIYANCLRKKPTGPPPSEVNRSRYASKEMKKNGYEKMTEGIVIKIVERLKINHKYLSKDIP